MKRDRAMPGREQPEAEYQKIKNYLMSLVYHAQHESVMVPSSHELAVQFNVARATATKALNQLMAENFLTARRGIGTFTNPVRMQNYGAPARIIGFLICNGKNIFYEYSSWVVLAVVGLELTRHDCFLSLIQLPETEDPERVEAEIRARNLDALIHVGQSSLCHPVLVKLTREGFPLLTMFCDGSTCNYDFSLEQSGYEIGVILAGERRGVFYAMLPWPRPELAAGIRRAYREAGCDLDFQTFIELSELREAVRKRPPDALYITAAFDTPILDMLEELGVDYRSACRLVTYRSKVIDSRYCGFQHVPPETELTSEMVRELLAMLDGKRFEPGNRLIPLQIRRINMEREE